MGSFCKPIQHQNSTKSKYRKSSTVVTGECSNNVKETGMAGIWSGAFTRRQMWGGGRESRSGVRASRLCSAVCLPASVLMTHPHAHIHARTYTFMNNTHSQQKQMSRTHTHTHKKKRYTAAESFCWRSWSLPLTAGSKSRGQREKEGARGRGRLSEERGVRGKTVQWTGTLTKDYFLNTELRHRG